MDITYGKLLYYCVVSEGNMDKKISTLDYNNRTVYDCFNNPFTYELGIPYLNVPPITFNDRPRPHKRARYTPDLLPAATYVAYGNYFITLTTPCDLPDLLPSDDTNTLHVLKKYVPFLGRVKRGCFFRKHDKNMLQK